MVLQVYVIVFTYYMRIFYESVLDASSNDYVVSIVVSVVLVFFLFAVAIAAIIYRKRTKTAADPSRGPRFAEAANQAVPAVRFNDLLQALDTDGCMSSEMPPPSPYVFVTTHCPPDTYLAPGFQHPSARPEDMNTSGSTVAYPSVPPDDLH